jgi:hypothetical protein
VTAQLAQDERRCCEVVGRKDLIQLSQWAGEPCPVCPEAVGLDPIPPFLPGLGRLIHRTLHLRQRQRKKRKPISSLFGGEFCPFETFERERRRSQVPVADSCGCLGVNHS